MSELAAKRDDARLGGLSGHVRGIADGAARYLDVEVRRTAGLALPPCPDEWRSTTLGSLGEFSTSSVDKKTDGSELPVRLVNYMDVYRQRFITDSMPLMVVTATRAEIAKSQLLKGDLLFTPSSETPDDIGHSAVVISNFPDALHSYHTVRLRFAADDEVDVRFAGRFANAAHTRKHLEVNATGSTRYTLSLGDFRSAPVRLPPIPEQKKISEVLDTLDTTIRQTEAIIAKLKQVKQGLLHDLLTRGIDVNGELRPPHSEAPHLYKPSPLGWIPKEWELCPLGELAEVARGKFTHRPRNDPAFFGGRYPFIQTGDVAGAAGGYVSVYSQTLSERGITVSQEFPEGTIAITIAANIADTAILAMPMYFPDSVVGAIVSPQSNVRFVELSIRRAKPRLDARAPQSAQKNINLQDLRPLLIAAPNKAEQDAIADRYDTIQCRLEAEETEASKLAALKSGLMDDLLTGRVRVTPLLEAIAA